MRKPPQLNTLYILSATHFMRKVYFLTALLNPRIKECKFIFLPLHTQKSKSSQASLHHCCFYLPGTSTQKNVSWRSISRLPRHHKKPFSTFCTGINRHEASSLVCKKVAISAICKLRIFPFTFINSQLTRQSMPPYSRRKRINSIPSPSDAEFEPAKFLLIFYFCLWMTSKPISFLPPLTKSYEQG